MVSCLGRKIKDRCLNSTRLKVLSDTLEIKDKGVESVFMRMIIIRHEIQVVSE